MGAPRVFVAGHRGMVGSAIVRRLSESGRVEIVTRDRRELDLTDQAAVREFFVRERLDQVYLAAARVGGIHANASRPAEIISENLMIEANVIQAAHNADVDRLLFLGSSCIYPKYAAQPIVEESLLTGPLEPTNAAYAVAKIAGLTLCASHRAQYGRDYRSLMPTNLYGPGDRYDPMDGHVIPGLVQRFHEARVHGASEVVVWGTGAPRREFLHVDDLAEASVFVMELSRRAYDDAVGGSVAHLNVGSGTDLSISDLADLIADVVGYHGLITFDPMMPDGTPRKLLDVSRLSRLGWTPSTTLTDGIRRVYADYVSNVVPLDGAPPILTAGGAA